MDELESVRQRFKNWKKILVAYAESAAGPGWANQTVCVIGLDKDLNLVQEMLQPSEQSQEMMTLFACSAAANTSMTGVAKWHLKVGI